MKIHEFHRTGLVARRFNPECMAEIEAVNAEVDWDSVCGTGVMQTEAHWFCTRPLTHEGVHVAGMHVTKRILARWTTEED